MNRKELAEELNVRPWDVDDWLLWGCPAEKFRTQWEFDIEQVKIWLRTEKIRIKRIKAGRFPIRPLKPYSTPSRPGAVSEGIRNASVRL